MTLSEFMTKFMLLSLKKGQVCNGIKFRTDRAAEFWVIGFQSVPLVSF